MEKTLAEIADAVGGEIYGDDKVTITGLNGVEEAQSGELTFISNSKYIPLLKKTRASAVLVSRDVKITGISYIQTDNPSLAFAKAFTLFYDEEEFQMKGIHKTAIIADDVKLGKNVSVGPYAIIESGVSIGDNTVIHGACTIGNKTRIGSDCIFHSQVVIRERIEIGNHVIVHNGTVIGSDGFGYEFVDGKHEKIPQIGTVVIEDDVEIGANVMIDRARFDKTFIGRGTKIDNLVQIAHNVKIEENCIIIAQVGISGSTVIEKNSILAGQAGLAGHLRIGAGSIVMAQAGVTKSIPPESKVTGFPAKPHFQAARLNACVNKLPEVFKEFEALKKRIEDLETENS